MPPSKHLLIIIPAILLLSLSLGWLFFGSGETGIVGNLLSKVFVSQKSQGICPIFLAPGWNLASLYCTAENMSIEAIFNSNGTNLTIYNYDSTDKNDTWKVYKGDLPEWVVLDLQELSTKKGYWINTESAIDLTVSGTINLPEFIELSRGWNMVGFPMNVSQPVIQALGGAAPVLLTIHKYEPLSSDPWKVYSTSSSENDLEDMEPNYGYWISTNGSVIWILDQ